MKLIFFVLALGFSLPSLYAGSGSDIDSQMKTVIGEDLKKGDIVELKGRIKVKGSEPFTFTVIETSDGSECELSGEVGEELRRQFELKMITLTGVVLSAGDEIRSPVIEVFSFEATDGT